MMKFLRLLRLSYSFSWALPYFAALVYLKGLYHVGMLDLSFAAAAVFYMISVNVHNDVCDGDMRGYKTGFLTAIALAFLALGIAVFPNTFVIAAAAITYIYNWKLKNIMYISLFPAAAPGIAISLMLGIYDTIFLLAIFFCSLASQSYHQLVDGEIRNKNYLYIFIFSSIATLALFSAAMFAIDAAVSWMLVVAGAMFVSDAMRIKSAAATTKRLFRKGKKLRARGVMLFWMLTAFLAGWYLLL